MPSHFQNLNQLFS